MSGDFAEPDPPTCPQCGDYLNGDNECENDECEVGFVDFMDGEER